eukprot:symbB.v1.2.005777.t1/scaffold289.1/size287290/22
MALVPSSGKDEASLFAEACSFVAEHRFYLRKAVDHGDFYKAIRHSLSLANELRSSQLGPQSYYKLYSMVFVELQHLGAYLLETERHGFSLEEVSEIVQYEGNCLPRLYLLVTVGMVRMLAAQESTDEILHDLDSMVRAVQHPVRGLFLRYFLLQAVKDKLPRLQSGMMGAMKFLLGTFKEVVILWQRLRVEAREAKVDSPRAWVLDDHRFSLRLLLGAHLMEISRLEGLTTQVYAEVVLPELLNLVPACEDAAGQAPFNAFDFHTLSTRCSSRWHFHGRLRGAVNRWLNCAMPIIKEERLRTYDPQGFKFDRMKEEVADAMKEDWKRDTIDDAKKRAITTTASYDEFRSRVAGCMLKPIHKNEFNAPAKFSFNSNTPYPAATVPTVSGEKTNRSNSKGDIRSIRELDKELRRRRTAEAWRDGAMNAEAVQRIFGREMDAEVFQKLLEALEQASKATVPEGTAKEFLTNMATLCPSSTSQATAFYSAEERKLLTRLLARDKAQIEDPEVVRLCASWSITPSSLAAALAECQGETMNSSPEAASKDQNPDCQAYVLQLIVEVFADAYHLDTLDKILSTCAQVHWSVNLKPLTQHLLRRLTSFLAENHRLGVAPGTHQCAMRFGFLTLKVKNSPSVLVMCLASSILTSSSCTAELCMYVLALNTGKESCMELLESTVALLEAPGVPYPLEPKLAQAVVDLMAAPLTQECLASPVLAMSYHKSLLAMMSRNMQAKAALAVVSALLAGDVSLGDQEMLQNLFALTDTLLRDETGREDVGEDLMRHLEHDPVVFRKEQETMAQLIHQMVFEMLSMLWEYFQQGGPHRIIFTVPAMVAAVLQLVGKFGPGMWGHVVKVFDFTQTLCTSLGTLAPQESVRLWLLCAACADKAAAKAEKGELVQQIASSIDHVLVCLDLHIPEQEARLRGLQLLVGTMRQMQVGLEEADLKKICDRAVALSSKMLSKRFQSKAFSLCCQLFWLPQLNFQDADRGLLCLRRALQSADGAIHSDPLDVGLFVDILNEVIHLFAEGASQVSPVLLSKILALYIGNRVPLDAMRALRAAIAGLAVKQKESVEAVMVGDVYIPYLDIDLRPAEQLPDAEAKI